MFNFAENKELQDLDKVPGNFRPFYERKDGDENGPYVLRSDPVVAAAVGALSGAHDALSKEREAHKATKAKTVDLAPLSEYGDNPEVIATSVTKKITDLQAQVKNGDAVKTQIEDMKREMTTAHGQVVLEKDKAIAELTQQLDDYMIDTEIAKAATRFPGLDPTLVKPFAKQHMQVDVDAATGRRTVMVLDNTGAPRFSMERAGERFSVGELLSDMSKNETYMQLFPSEARRGADTNPAHQAHRTARQAADGGDKSPAGKIARGLQSRQQGIR